MPTELCSVCGEALTPTCEATCDSCGKLYHLNQRSDLPGKDCGQVWINEEHLALEFGCDTCLAPPTPPEANLDDVLDADEAAEVAGMPVAGLIAAAERGSLRHRKTARGVYLFERRDVVAFGRR